MNAKGVSLIELLAATALIIMVMSSLSLFFPKASKAAVMNRYLTTGKNLAITKLQELKENPYPLVPVTSTATFTFPLSGMNAFPLNGCDCSLEDPDTYPIVSPTIDIVNDHGITFTRRTCTNLIYRNGPNWSSYCPDGTSSTDLGLKYIRVRVSWIVARSTGSIDAESMVAQ